jgi:hypothetical protein
MTTSRTPWISRQYSLNSRRRSSPNVRMKVGTEKPPDAADQRQGEEELRAKEIEHPNYA